MKTKNQLHKEINKGKKTTVKQKFAAVLNSRNLSDDIV